MKKVLVLTLEQGGNYGGMMQAYALQSYLHLIGMESETTWATKRPWLSARCEYWLRTAMRLFRPSILNLSPSDKSLIRVNTNEFIKTHMKVVSYGDAVGRARSASAPYAAIIVGSDQVWRPEYVDVARYLLKDVGVGRGVRKVSYAASFGRDDLSEFSAELLGETARLAKEFDALSVREDSGVGLVGDHWGLEAKHHVDPTMLLSQGDYGRLIEEYESSDPDTEDKLYVYVLDRSSGRGEIIDRTEQLLDAQRFEVLPEEPVSRRDLHASPSMYILPRITKWLKGFSDAKFVVTDSFHGAVFSIIFNKPFIAIGNASRGMARFTSLLKTFNLEDRLVLTLDEISKDLLMRPIDWTAVNKRLEREKARSYEYLVKCIEGSGE